MASLIRAACVAAGSYAGAQPVPADGEWPSYGGTNWSRKYLAAGPDGRRQLRRLPGWRPLVGTPRCTESPARMQRGPSYGYSSVPGAVPAMNAS